jgi:hypothetical protein
MDGMPVWMAGVSAAKEPPQRSAKREVMLAERSMMGFS